MTDAEGPPVPPGTPGATPDPTQGSPDAPPPVPHVPGTSGSPGGDPLDPPVGVPPEYGGGAPLPPAVPPAAPLPPGVPPPQYPAPEYVYEYAPQPTPGVYTWFVVYCVLNVLAAICLVCLGIVGLAIDPAEIDASREEVIIGSVVYLGCGTFMFFPYLAAPFLPRRPWVWIYDLVLICLGMTSCACLPICIPLLIFWIKPEVRAYFGST